MVTLFLSYRAWATHHKVKDEIVEEVESESLILQLAVNHLTVPFLEVTIHRYVSTTPGAQQNPIIDVCVNNTKHLAFTYSYNYVLCYHDMLLMEWICQASLHNYRYIVAACMYMYV